MQGADPSSDFRAGNGERWFNGLGGSAAEPHALKRPLDGPASAGQAAEKIILRVDGVDQPGSGFGSNDLLDHAEGSIRTARKHGSDMPGLPAVADQRDRIAVRQ